MSTKAKQGSGRKSVNNSTDSAVISGLPVVQSAVITDDALLEQLHRIEKLPKDVGWILFTVGVAGFILPGIIGFPFMIAGGLVLWPGSEKRILRMAKKPSNTLMRAGLKQVVRYIDDLDRRFPVKQP